jgi:[acyl-carrier-protein] S-malonyltransferase
MDKIAIIFPGQGAHSVGMGSLIYGKIPSAKECFDTIDHHRPDTSSQCFNGPLEVLNQTSNTQPCIFSVEYATFIALSHMGIKPQGIAGFSLGEITGLVAASILSLDDGLSFVIARGKAMENASKHATSTMVAVLKLENNHIENLCKKFNQCYPVNYNCPKQLVVALQQKDLTVFLNEVKQLGGRGLPLGLSGGFHSPFMNHAVSELEPILNQLFFSKATIPLYGNSMATPYPIETEAIKNTILHQINHPVLWEKTISNMITDGFTTFIEVGPGKVLGGFLKKINSSVRYFHSSDLIHAYLEKQDSGKEWSLEC